MAVAVLDTATDAPFNTTFDSGTPVNVTFTVSSGSNLALEAEIILYVSGSPVTDAITAVWDPAGANQPMIAIVGTDANVAGTFNGRTIMFGLVNPTPKSSAAGAVIRFTKSGATAYSGYASGTSFTGVNQTGGTTSFANGTTNTATSSNESVTVTSAVGNFTKAVHAPLGPVVNSVSPTQLFIDNSGVLGNGAANYATGAASVSLTAALATSGLWLSAGVNIVAAGGVAVNVLGISTPSMYLTRKIIPVAY